MQLPSKASFTTFCSLIALILGEISVKGLRLTDIVKELKFEGVSVELGGKKIFQRQSFTKYNTLVFM